MTNVVNVKVKYIRPVYNKFSLEDDRMKNPNHEYIGRKGLVFINKQRFPNKSVRLIHLQ